MSDTFGIGVNALRAFQRALSTTGHNIANVNTPGFSRQSAEFSANAPQFSGIGYLGRGVEISSIQRNYDGFVVEHVRNSQSSFAQQQVMYEMSAQMGNLLGDSATSLSTSLQSFFNSVHEVADDPSSTAARQVMLTEGETLSERFHLLHKGIEDVRERTNSEIRATVSEINTLATNIADLNRKIVDALGQAGNNRPPNDLLDQRDALVEELAQCVSVTGVEQGDGSLSVFIGSGQNLVLGTHASTLTASPLGVDPQHLDIGVAIPGSTVRITDRISGGKLSGLFEFRDKVLDPSQNALGNVSIGLAATFNAQHQKGMGLDGVVGHDFFTLPEANVLADLSNAGPGPAVVGYDDVAQLTTDEYRLDFDGSAWTLTRVGDGQTEVFESGSGTLQEPYIVKGLSIVIDPSAVAGDSYFIQPSRFAADEIALAVNEGSQIAATGALYAEAASTNAGDGKISAVEVLDPANPDLLEAVNIVFDDPPSIYRINGGEQRAYSSGDNIDYNGFRVQISGNPQGGDEFTVSGNVGGVGDNRNALALAELQQALTLGGGTANFDDAYGEIVADVGTRTAQAEINASAQANLLEQAQSTRESISGVSLDKEAADLLKFQQAYQAAAQMIAVADSLFESLIDAVRR